MRAGGAEWREGSQETSADRHHCSFIELSSHPTGPEKAGTKICQCPLTWITLFAETWSLPEILPYSTATAASRPSFIGSRPSTKASALAATNPKVCKPYMSGSQSQYYSLPQRPTNFTQMVADLSLHCGSHQVASSPAQVAASLSLQGTSNSVAPSPAQVAAVLESHCSFH